MTAALDGEGWVDSKIRVAARIVTQGCAGQQPALRRPRHPQRPPPAPPAVRGRCGERRRVIRCDAVPRWQCRGQCRGQARCRGARLLDYTTLRFIHISAVAISGGGFLARAAGTAREAPWVRGRAARTLPHLVDTVLLLSALGMLWVAHLSPWALPWLRAKLIGLLCYIALGVLALRGLRAAPPRAATPGRRIVALGAGVLALAVFLYIVSVALTKDPRGLFAALAARD